MQDTMAMNRLLLVEDDPELRERMKWALGEHFQVVEADSVESALARLEPGALRWYAWIWVWKGIRRRDWTS